MVVRGKFIKVREMLNLARIFMFSTPKNLLFFTFSFRIKMFPF